MSEITREVGETKGRYTLTIDGAEAELTYSILSPRTIIADHTYVPDALRGTGAGVKLAERLVADAREEGVKIVPLCPFVKAQAAKHPDWSDVIQK
ncbi:GNAT family N-acetyltransferase [Hasllibacter sp. MH4015]|uniref:GNAT family N-acetyltransferase n=1 Tax=Hasllibacter sp. MH4015 TaxID=2854029 RepID=UPI001CD554E3|nr:GNAT family N-acetyltransferase [Hasllibacter sp. MH4015]